MQFIHIFAQATAGNVAFFTTFFANLGYNLSGLPYKYKKAEGDVTSIDQFGNETLKEPATENQKYIFAGVEKSVFEQTDFGSLDTPMISFENNTHIDYLETNFYKNVES